MSAVNIGSRLGWPAGLGCVIPRIAVTLLACSGIANAQSGPGAMDCRWSDSVTQVVEAQVVTLYLSCEGGSLSDKQLTFTWAGINVSGAVDSSGRGQLLLAPFLVGSSNDTVTITAQVCASANCGSVISRQIRRIDQRPVLNADRLDLVPGDEGALALLGNDVPAAGVSLDTLSVTLAGGQQIATGQRLNGVVLSWDPVTAVATVNVDQDAAFGVRQFTYTAKDSLGRAAAQPAAIRINVVMPAPPVAKDDRLAGVVARVTASGNIVLNDSPSALPSSVDLDPDAPGQQTAVSTAAGLWSAAVDGIVSFTASPGFTGDVAIRYTVSDGYGQVSNVAFVRTSVALPAPPVAIADRVTALAGATVSIDALANDHATGAGNQLRPETILLDSSANPQDPAAGSWRVNAGRLLWSGAPGFVGTVTQRYTVADLYGQTTTATVVQVDVLAPPPPQAIAATWRTAKRQGISAHIWDPALSDASTTLALVSADGRAQRSWQSVDGVASINADGSVTILPSAAFVGTLIVPFRLADRYAGSTSAAITLTVVADAIPAAQSDELLPTPTPTQPQLSSSTVTSNDIAYGGSRIAAATVKVIPVIGGDASAWTVLGDGRVTYQPPSGYSGTARAIYTVRDGAGLESNTAELSATVHSPSPVVGATIMSPAGADDAVAVPTLSAVVMCILSAVLSLLGAYYSRREPLRVSDKTRRAETYTLALASALVAFALAPPVEAQDALPVSGTTSSFIGPAGLTSATSFVYNNGHRCSIYDTLVLCDYSIDLLSPVANVPSVSPNLNCRQAPAMPGNVPAGVATTLRLDVLCDSNGLGYSYSGTDVVGTQNTLTKSEIVTGVTLAAGAQKTYTLTVCSRLVPSSCDQFFWIVRAGGSSAVLAPSGCTLLASATTPSANQLVSFVVTGCSDALGATFSYTRGGVVVAGTNSATANFAPLPSGTSSTTVAVSICTTAGCQTPSPSLTFSAGTGSAFMSCLDIDGDGVQRAATDGLILNRLLLGMRGQNALTGAIAPGAPRATWTAVSAFLAACGWIL